MDGENMKNLAGSFIRIPLILAAYIFLMNMTARAEERGFHFIEWKKDSANAVLSSNSSSGINLPYILEAHAAEGKTLFEQTTFSEEELGDLFEFNYSGLHFRRSIGPISIEVKRELSPDFVSQGFVVKDFLHIRVRADVYLGDLKKGGVIDISQNHLGLFAGLDYLRSFKFTHREPNYEEAMFKNFDKLFTNYKYLQNPERLANGESISQEQRLIASARATLGFGVSSLFIGGSLIGDGKSMTKKELRVFGLEGEESFFFEYEKMKELNLGVSLFVALDIAKIFHLTLFSFTYEYKKSDHMTSAIQMNRLELEEVQRRGSWKKALSGKAAYEKDLFPFLISHKRSTGKSKKKRTRFLASVYENEEKLKLTEDFKNKEALDELNYVYQKSRQRISLVREFLNNFSKKKLNLEIFPSKVTEESTGQMEIDIKNDGSLYARFERYNFVKKAKRKKKEAYVRYLQGLKFAPIISGALRSGQISAPLILKWSEVLNHNDLKDFLNLDLEVQHQRVRAACNVLQGKRAKKKRKACFKNIISYILNLNDRYFEEGYKARLVKDFFKTAYKYLDYNTVRIFDPKLTKMYSTLHARGPGGKTLKTYSHLQYYDLPR